MEKIKIRVWIPETKKMQFVEMKDFLNGLVPLNLKDSCEENMSLCINKKDSKGMVLYENDIVIVPMNDRANFDNKSKNFAAVIQGDFEYGFGFKLQHRINLGAYRYYPDIERCTKIGNLFEHPHLFPVIPKK